MAVQPSEQIYAYENLTIALAQQTLFYNFFQYVMILLGYTD